MQNHHHYIDLTDADKRKQLNKCSPNYFDESNLVLMNFLTIIIHTKAILNVMYYIHVEYAQTIFHSKEHDTSTIILNYIKREQFKPSEDNLFAKNISECSTRMRERNSCK